MPVEWFIRINLPSEPKFLRDLNINYSGLVINFRTALMLYKNRHADIVLNTSTIIIDPDLTFMSCIAPEEKKTVELSYEMFGLKGREPQWDKHPLDVSTLRDDEIQRIAKVILDFQRKFMLSGMSMNVLEFFGISAEPRSRNYILLAPYFVMTHINSAEYIVNKKLLEHAIQIKRNNEKLYAVIAIDKALLSNIDALKRIIKDYIQYSDKIDGYAIWITDFDETEEDVDSLKRFIGFLYTLKKLSKKHIINLYGGYFSLMLSKLSIIDAIVTKMCYRQRRSRCTISGGHPIEWYYFPLVKTKIDIRTVASIVQMDETLKCRCPICSGHFDEIVKKELTKPRSATRELKKHFLYVFNDEVKHVFETSLGELLDELKQNYDKAEEYIQPIGRIDHLMTWYNALTEFLELLK